VPIATLLRGRDLAWGSETAPKTYCLTRTVPAWELGKKLGSGMWHGTVGMAFTVYQLKLAGVVLPNALAFKPYLPAPNNAPWQGDECYFKVTGRDAWGAPTGEFQELYSPPLLLLH